MIDFLKFIAQVPETPVDTLLVIMERLENIDKNTDSFADFWSGSASVIAMIASIATIFGLLGLWYEMHKRNITKACQKRIIMDLIRHMMVNNSIVEVIRSKMASSPSYRPAQGVLERFATLESDVDLARFSVNEQSYETIHNISLKIRNYNSVVMVAETKFQNPKLAPAVLEKDLDDIFYRAVEISNKLQKLSVNLDITLTDKELYDYIVIDKYGEEWKNKAISERKMNQGFPIITRTDKEKPYLQYYDKLGVKPVFDDLIRHHSTRI